MTFEEVLPLLGEFGRYQKRIYLLLCLPTIACAFHKLVNVFIHAKLNHRCQLPNEFSNASYALSEDRLNSSYPFDSNTNKFSSCYMYERNNTVACSAYIYDNSVYKSSIVTDWNLVCDESHYTTTADTLFMVGVMLGSIIFGGLSDRFGRKPIFFISLVLQVVFGLSAAFAPEYWTYTLSRLIIGSTTSGVFLVAYVIGMEMVGPRYRLAAGIINHMFFSVGYLLTTLFAYFIREWRALQIALTVPGVVFFCYWWFIPESARWLITKNRVPEAVRLIQTAAKENKVSIATPYLEQLLVSDVDTKEKATILDIFRYPGIRQRSLIIFFGWLVNGMAYYGLSWNTSNLGGNDYVNFLIAGAVEFPAYMFLLLTLNRWGRKRVLCGSMVAAGVVLLLTMAVPEDQQWLLVTLAMLGKLTITGSYGTIYVFSVEQFPTVIRNVALGTGSVFSRIGAILAPQINSTSKIWRPLPLIIFGALALIVGCLALLLPETADQQLQETMADVEQKKKGENDLSHSK